MKTQVLTFVLALMICFTPAAFAAEGKGKEVTGMGQGKVIGGGREESEDNVDEEIYGKTKGLLGPVVVGPKLTLGVLLPLRFGLEGKWNNLFGLSFDYGILPAISRENVSVSANGWSILARYFPWERAFFIGFGMGSQSLKGANTDTVNGQSITATINYTTPFLLPQIGWRWVWKSGFFMGMELGAQIPLSHSFSLSTNRPDLEADPAFAADIQELEDEANAQSDKLSSNPLPWIGLVSIGYYF